MIKHSRPWALYPNYKNTVIERIERDSSPSGDCRIWTKYLNRNGYPYLYAFGKTMPVHKALLIALDRFPLNNERKWEMVVDHICRIRSCCNPQHLRVVTTQTNATDNSGSKSAQNKRKTHCPKGHEFNEENTLIQKKVLKSGSTSLWRRCKFCTIEQRKMWDAKKSAMRKLKYLEAAMTTKVDTNSKAREYQMKYEVGK